MFPENRLMEVLIIGALALIVVGPKDLPILMRRVGQFVAKMRGMAAEFRSSFDELARQSELDDLRKEVQALRGHADALNPLAAPHVADTFNEINQGLTPHMTPLGSQALSERMAAAEAAQASSETSTPPVEAAAPTETPPKPKRAPRKPRAKVSDS